MARSQLSLDATEEEFDQWCLIERRCTRCPHVGTNGTFPMAIARGSWCVRSWCHDCLKAYYHDAAKTRYARKKQLKVGRMGFAAANGDVAAMIESHRKRVEREEKRA